jgi:hypothetical protein
MKKTILMFFVLFSSFLSAQVDVLDMSLLEGEWKSNETSYNCIITVNNEDEVKTIHNISYEKNKVLSENIKFQDEYQVVTTHTNKKNGHTVESTYILVNPELLSRQFRGDSNMMIFYTRVKNN